MTWLLTKSILRNEAFKDHTPAAQFIKRYGIFEVQGREEPKVSFPPTPSRCCISNKDENCCFLFNDHCPSFPENRSMRFLVADNVKDTGKNSAFG
jgi:hypothetical protein